MDLIDQMMTDPNVMNDLIKGTSLLCVYDAHEPSDNLLTIQIMAIGDMEGMKGTETSKVCPSEVTSR